MAHRVRNPQDTSTALHNGVSGRIVGHYSITVELFKLTILAVPWPSGCKKLETHVNFGAAIDACSSSPVQGGLTLSVTAANKGSYHNGNLVVLLCARQMLLARKWTCFVFCLLPCPLYPAAVDGTVSIESSTKQINAEIQKKVHLCLHASFCIAMIHKKNQMCSHYNDVKKSKNPALNFEITQN